MGHDSKFHDGLERERKKHTCVCVCVHKKEHIYEYIYIYDEISPGARSKNNEKLYDILIYLK